MSCMLVFRVATNKRDLEVNDVSFPLAVLAVGTAQVGVTLLAQHHHCQHKDSYSEPTFLLTYFM